MNRQFARTSKRDGHPGFSLAPIGESASEGPVRGGCERVRGDDSPVFRAFLFGLARFAMI